DRSTAASCLCRSARLAQDRRDDPANDLFRKRSQAQWSWSPAPTHQAERPPALGPFLGDGLVLLKYENRQNPSGGLDPHNLTDAVSVPGTPTSKPETLRGA